MKLSNYFTNGKFYLLAIIVACALYSCKKKGSDNPINKDTSLYFTVNGSNNGTLKYINLSPKPVIKFNFTEPVNPTTVKNSIIFKDASGTVITIITTYEDDNKVVNISPKDNLASFGTYTLSVNDQLKSASGGNLINPVNITLVSGLDNTDKFPRITDDELLTLVQKQTFKYFWDFGHPTSGLARERNTSGDVVTTGGSGFGVMAIVTGISRNFITRAEGLARLQKIVAFLKNADRFHGAYSHWLDGNTGKVIPFSTKDNGADLVETSYLMQGLITARQYFTGNDAAETTLRNDITNLYNGVEWSWFRKDGGNVLYWHWSPTYNWDMNLPLQGWNEALNTYIMAASSPTYSIPKSVYDLGWARSGAMKNGNTYYGVQLPLGVANGGPLFLAHYTFLGVNPMGLVDTYANYETQTKAHTLINYNYCVANPAKNVGYSAECWGLTASDVPNGYAASSPSNDLGVIAPTAALSSFPYTPTESMAALKFFYYKLGDKIWKDYGFVDAFKLNDPWFASSTLAIDQGPIIIMIENHRTKLLWNLFMSAPEIKMGMKGLGFTSPNL
ncbi:glucoamylase family protein [Pedobacter boryungensis]|uniref:Ig-like domain-containing protein n=1 Tax=Pedobacter boryungensis TaxID=869962 RepID=A0ABX2DHC1_9SPHI|nr:glucoamylase family protein [Pedobacter boryungensis]NQX32524.1 Ig-like domain-containing protein [Pedobacter boryungensis]